MVETIYELTLRHVVLENTSLVIGYIICCLGVYFANRIRVRYFDGEELEKSKSKTFLAVLMVVFLVIVLWAYKTIKQETDYLAKLGQEIPLYTQIGVLKSLHDYSNDWDLTKFSIGERTFSFRKEEIKATDFNLDQNEIDKLEGELIEIVYAEDLRIVSLKVLNDEGN